MTQSIKIIASTVLLTLAFFSNAFAQEATTIATIEPSSNLNPFNAQESNGIKTDAATNPVVAAKFSTLFPTATNPKWATNAKNCWVSFLNNSRKTKASFTLKGKVNYVITNCTMENLPASFSKTITTEYATYQLLDAIEITAHGTVVHQAVLEDSKGFITLKYTTEGVEEIQQVKKQ